MALQLQSRQNKYRTKQVEAILAVKYLKGKSTLGKKYILIQNNNVLVSCKKH